jgi:iron complex outermembrane receptor protein
VRLDDSFAAALPKAGLAYRFNRIHNVYFTAAEGYQSGGFNSANDNPAEARYRASRSWHYEVGYKAVCVPEVFSSKVAAFYSTIDGYQVFRFNQADPTQAFLINADSAYTYGAELELQARPLKQLELTARGAVTEARFNRFDYASAGQRFDFGGRRVNFVPRFTTDLAVQYRFPCNFFARVEVQGIGQYWLDEANTARQGAFALVNLRAGYETEHLEVFVFARNLFDKEYFNNALDFRSGVRPDLLVRQPGDPLTFGVGISARF